MTDTGDIASRIDHTLLRPEATTEQVDRLADEAAEHGFATVCVNSAYAHRVSRRLEAGGVKTCTTAGFPLGANMPMIKAIEAARSLESGADEVDVVAHLPYLLEANYDAIHSELMEVLAAAQQARTDAVLKVIVETAVLMEGVSGDVAERRIETACRAVRDAGADFIKTSTGFHPAGGASVEAVRLLAKHAGGLKVKAAGGIRTRADAEAMLEAGADRLGCSASVRIVGG